MQAFIKRHEGVLLPLALLFGFAVDSITLRRVDLLPETILVYAYLVVSGGAILLAHLIEEKVWRGSLAERVKAFLPLVQTYAIGSLFSAFVIFYVKSASIVDSWPFILVLISVVVGIEVLKTYEHRFVLYLAVYFLALFSFTIFAVPLWVGEIGTEVFVLSGFVALVLFSVFLYALYVTGKKRIESIFNSIAFSVAVCFFAVSGLYITNTLPPIPLALKDIGVYQNVTKQGTGYVLTGEPRTFIDRLFGIAVHVRQGGELYVFSSVFTPVAIKTEIIHVWERWNPEEEQWVEWSRVSFPAHGGRDEGYRGFSMIGSASAGLWRVSVETENGLKIGRVEFTVVSEAPKGLVTEVR